MFMWDGWDEGWNDVYPFISLCTQCGDEIETNMIAQQSICLDCRVAQICPPEWEIQFMIQIMKWYLSQP